MMSQVDCVPMTMASFFEASRGTWLNRRVVHHLDCQDDEAADSNLIIEPFDQHDPAIAKVCAALNVDSNDAATMITQLLLLMPHIRKIHARVSY